MHRSILLLLVLAAGCGGSEPAARKAEPKSAPQIDRYAMTMSAQQKEQILPDGPKRITGRWMMVLNRTVGVVDLLAPDGGGLTLYVEEMTGDRLVLEDPDCGDARLTFSLERSGEELRLSEGRGRCQETIDLLSLNPWSAA